MFIGAAPAGAAFDAMVRQRPPPAAGSHARPGRGRAARRTACCRPAGGRHPAAAPGPAPRRRPPDGQPPSDPGKLPPEQAEAGLPDVEGGGGIAAVPAGPTEPGAA